MKKLILGLAIAGCFAFSRVNAQTINSVKLSDLKAEYIEVSESGRFFSERVSIRLEYGQKKGFDNFRNLIVQGDDGKDLAYNSVMEFVNMMKDYGYELFQVYVIVSGDNSSPKYMLKRKSS